MTRYGILPPIVNVCYPATSTAAAITGLPAVQQHHNQPQPHPNYQAHPHLELQSHQHQQQHRMAVNSQQQHQGQDMHYMDSSGGGGHTHQQHNVVELIVPQQGRGGMASSNTNEMANYGPGDPHSQGHNPGMGNPQQQRLEMIPYQLTQQQARVLFGSNMLPAANQMISNNPNEGNGG